MLPSCLGPAVQHGGSENLWQLRRVHARKLLEDIWWIIYSRRILTVYCIWYEIPEILLFRNGWMKKVTLNFGVYLYEGFPLAHPNTWKLECYQPKTGRLLHLTHVLQCHCCNLFDWIGLDVDFHRVFFQGKIIAPKATATGAGAVGCQTWQWSCISLDEKRVYCDLSSAIFNRWTP